MTKLEIIKAGRAELARQLAEAAKAGEIHYAVTHVARSGMSRRIVLAYIAERSGGVGHTLVNIFPTLPDDCAHLGNHEYSGALDIVARDWRYSYKYRAFVIGGCGMDMVFALVDDLAGSAGMSPKFANSITRTSMI